MKNWEIQWASERVAESMNLKQRYDTMTGWPEATVTTGETATVQGLDDIIINMDNWSRETQQSSEP